MTSGIQASNGKENSGARAASANISSDGRDHQGGSGLSGGHGQAGGSGSSSSGGGQGSGGGRRNSDRDSDDGESEVDIDEEGQEEEEGEEEEEERGHVSNNEVRRDNEGSAVVAEAEEVVRSLNPGTPAVHQGNWLSFETLMNDTFPSKSKVVYLSAYKKFEQFLKNSNKFEPDMIPSETSLLNYFHHLKNERFFAPTTLWSIFSRLNAVFKRKYRFSLKTLPSVSDLLKSYEVGHRVKKSSVFTPQQVVRIDIF